MYSKFEDKTGKSSYRCAANIKKHMWCIYVAYNIQYIINNNTNIWCTDSWMASSVYLRKLWLY